MVFNLRLNFLTNFIRKVSDNVKKYDYFFNPCTAIQCTSGVLATAVVMHISDYF
jgi:hypothetical protein